MNKIFINCPFNEKEEVKKLGAKWSAVDKSWYILPSMDSSLFSKWLNVQDSKLPIVADNGIQGKGGLYIDLVPKNCWYSNVRELLSQSDWDIIKRKVYQEANYRCIICEGKGKNHPVEAHERWIFNIETKTQILKTIESLCPACHEATHFGLAEVKGRRNIAKNRLMYVNNWDSSQTEKHIEESFKIWQEKNKYTWFLDISWLLSFIELDYSSQEIIKNLKDKKISR